MKVKASELAETTLDWAVAKAEGDEPLKVGGVGLRYSSDWSVAGLIIEREKISIEWTGEDWMAYIWHDEEFFGSTPLLAAMCCYVASKLGDEIELPEELTTFKT